MAENKLYGEGYQGAFTIQLYENVSIDFLNEGKIPFEKDGNKIIIADGSANQSMGAIQLRSKGKSFYFSYNNMVRITGANNETLWENYEGEVRKTKKKVLGFDPSDRKAAQGKFRAVVSIGAEMYHIGEDTDTAEEALTLCSEYRGTDHPVQIFDDEGVPKLDKGELIV